jgi:hypothetical protein
LGQVWTGLSILALVMGVLVLGRSYRVRDGQRHNMLAGSLREGLIKSLYVIPLAIILVVIGLSLGLLT